jgi:hypothetical protein
VFGFENELILIDHNRIKMSTLGKAFNYFGAQLLEIDYQPHQHH